MIFIKPFLYAAETLVSKRGLPTGKFSAWGLISASRKRVITREELNAAEIAMTTAFEDRERLNLRDLLYLVPNYKEFTTYKIEKIQ